MSLSTATSFLGAGDVYFAPWLTGGAMGKLLDTGNTTKLGIKAKSKRKDQISKKRESYGNVLGGAALPEPTEISIVMETVNTPNMRYLFNGENATYAQSSATVTAEAFIAKLDGWVQLAKESLADTGVVIKKGSTTLVEGTDYDMNRRLGMVRILSTNTASVAEDDPMTAGYSAQAFTGVAIRGNVNPQIRAFVLLDGVNKVDDSIGILRVWEAILTPAGEFDWFKDDLNKIELGGILNVPAGKTEPFRFYAR